MQGRNGGATAHFAFLVATQQVVSLQEGRGVRNRRATALPQPRRCSRDMFSLAPGRDINFVSRHGRWARDLTPFGPRLRHRFEVATWLRLGLVGLGRDMNFMSRHGLDILRSLHQFEVATWLSWGRQVLGHDMIFMSRQGGGVVRAGQAHG